MYANFSNKKSYLLPPVFSKHVLNAFAIQQLHEIKSNSMLLI